MLYKFEDLTVRSFFYTLKIGFINSDENPDQDFEVKIMIAKAYVARTLLYRIL